MRMKKRDEVQGEVLLYVQEDSEGLQSQWQNPGRMWWE